ncbi:MAG TPA: hypothetical protein ENJ35_00115, partial [Gammaproteobacteria bacterium]|nr:hypothetical protein [Gammaproteobacteria bacterium]
MKYGQISKFMSSMGLLLLTAGYVSAELHPYRSEITRSDLQGERHVLGIASPDTIRAVQSGAGITQNVFTSVASYGTGFEPVEGFSPGYIGGQSGWTSFLTSMIEAHVDVSTPATGVQHLQVAKDPFLPVGFFVGGFSPYLGPQPSDPTTVSVEINISALNNGADYYVTPQAPTQGLKTAEVVFEWTGDIKVLDFVGGMWLYYDTLHDWVPGAYKKLEIDIDPGANTIDYYYDGSLIYTSAGGVWGATSVEEVVL